MKLIWWEWFGGTDRVGIGSSGNYSGGKWFGLDLIGWDDDQMGFDRVGILCGLELSGSPKIGNKYTCIFIVALCMYTYEF